MDSCLFFVSMSSLQSVFASFFYQEKKEGLAAVSGGKVCGREKSLAYYFTDFCPFPGLGLPFKAKRKQKPFVSLRRSVALSVPHKPIAAQGRMTGQIFFE